MPPAGNHHRYLIYWNVQKGVEAPSEEILFAHSPVSCLHKATRKSFDLIGISFDVGSLKERDALVELCSVLKANSLTLSIPLLCLLPSRHRKLLERLQETGVEHAMVFDSRRHSLEAHLEAFMRDSLEGFSIRSLLSELCPNVNPVPISRRQEILYCGAYRNRLVLGPYLLNLYCETINHRNCPYYNDPKPVKDSGTRTS